jgi:hypothetical protein
MLHLINLLHVSVDYAHNVFIFIIIEREHKDVCIIYHVYPISPHFNLPNVATWQALNKGLLEKAKCA